MRNYGLNRYPEINLEPVKRWVGASDDWWSGNLVDPAHKQTAIYSKNERKKRIGNYLFDIRGANSRVVPPQQPGGNFQVMVKNRSWKALEKEGWSMTFWSSRKHGYKICPIKKMIWVPKPSSYESLFPMIRAIHLAHLLVNAENCRRNLLGPGNFLRVPNLSTIHLCKDIEDIESKANSSPYKACSYPTFTSKRISGFKSILDMDLHPDYGSSYRNDRASLGVREWQRFSLPIMFYKMPNADSEILLRNHGKKAEFSIANKRSVYLPSFLHASRFWEIEKSCRFLFGHKPHYLFLGRRRALRAIAAAINVAASDIEAVHNLAFNKKYKKWWPFFNQDTMAKIFGAGHALLEIELSATDNISFAAGVSAIEYTSLLKVSDAMTGYRRHKFLREIFSGVNSYVIQNRPLTNSELSCVKAYKRFMAAVEKAATETNKKEKTTCP